MQNQILSLTYEVPFLPQSYRKINISKTLLIVTLNPREGYIHGLILILNIRIRESRVCNTTRLIWGISPSPTLDFSLSRIIYIPSVTVLLVSIRGSSHLTAKYIEIVTENCLSLTPIISIISVSTATTFVPEKINNF